MFGGGGVAVSGSYCVVGAHNRDTVVSGTNAGAAYMFDLGILNTNFASLEVSNVEGGQGAGLWPVWRATLPSPSPSQVTTSEAVGTLQLNVQRCTPSCLTGDTSGELNLK